MKKVITHAGTFHADELLALATYHYFADGGFDFMNIEHFQRQFQVSEHELNDPEIVIIDMGRSFDPALGNFDHHQDPSLPASNLLILRHFVPEGRFRDLLEEYLFKYVSDCDLGGEKSTAPTLTSIIRGLNNLKQTNCYDLAFRVAQTALLSAVATANARMKSEEQWDEVEKIGKVAITDSTEHIVGWHELAEADGILMLVTPNQRGGYQITSRSTDVFIIPENELQTFRHNSGFLAAYATKDDAVNHAMSL
jgi:uncharacterized UPF0160 family protein